MFKYANEYVLNQPATRYPNKIDKIDENENVIKTYESARIASLDLKISCNTVHKILRGDRKKTKDGHRFKYH